MQKRNRLTYDTVLEIPQKNPEMQSHRNMILTSPGPIHSMQKDEKCSRRPEIDILLKFSSLAYFTCYYYQQEAQKLFSMLI